MVKILKTLAFEASAKAASVCLLDDDKILGSYYQNAGFTHSKTLLPMAENLLSSLSLTMEDIDRLAVSIGPGSFTGIRIAVSTVKGLAFYRNIPCVAVSTLHAMAANFGESDMILCPVMDARANQVYNALFSFTHGKLTRLCEDRAISLEDLKDELSTLNKKYILIGDGAKLCMDYLPEENKNIARENMLYQNAYGVALCSLDMESISHFDLDASYLRLPQAERQRLEKEGGTK